MNINEAKDILNSNGYRLLDESRPRPWRMKPALRNDKGYQDFARENVTKKYRDERRVLYEKILNTFKDFFETFNLDVKVGEVKLEIPIKEDIKKIIDNKIDTDKLSVLRVRDNSVEIPSGIISNIIKKLIKPWFSEFKGKRLSVCWVIEDSDDFNGIVESICSLFKNSKKSKNIFKLISDLVESEIVEYKGQKVLNYETLANKVENLVESLKGENIELDNEQLERMGLFEYQGKVDFVGFFSSFDLRTLASITDDTNDYAYTLNKLKQYKFNPDDVISYIKNSKEDMKLLNILKSYYKYY